MTTKSESKWWSTGTIGLYLALLGVFGALMAPGEAEASIIYVKADAQGSATGASWADAYTSLQDGLAAAVGGDEIWVASGTYKPDQGKGVTPGDRNATLL